MTGLYVNEHRIMEIRCDACEATWLRIKAEDYRAMDDEPRIICDVCMLEVKAKLMPEEDNCSEERGERFKAMKDINEDNSNW